MDGASDRITALFNERDPLINAGGNHPFWLNGGSIWLVQKGWVDIFCVRQTTTGRVTGRTHVTRIPQGQCVVGVMTADGKDGGATGMLQAVSRPGTKLHHLPAATAHERFGTRTARAEAADLIDGWVHAVCTGLTDDPRPRDCQAIRQTSTIYLDRGVTVFPASRVSWIAHRDGRSRLIGQSELPMGEGLIPCTKQTWFETDTPVDIAVLSTQTVLATSDIWVALASLQRVATRCAVSRMEKEATHEAVRQGQRDANRRQLLTSAFAELVAAHDVSPARPGTTTANTTSAVNLAGTQHDASFVHACHLVGEALGVPLVSSPKGGAESASDPVAATARVSGVRVRQVMLEEGWWRSDNGPLLARTRGANPTWISLIPERPGRYLLHDSSPGNVPRRVTAAVAETLAPIAHTFYRPFPTTGLSFRTIVGFGMRGCSRDAVAVILLGLAGGVLGLVTPVATGAIFNTIIPSAERDQLWQMTCILIACSAATGMFELGRRLSLTRLDGRLGAAVQAALWDRLLNLPLSFFRPYSSGDLAVRAMGIDTIRQTLSGATVTAALGGMFSLSNICLLFYYGKNLAWWAMLLLAVVVAMTMAIGYRQLKLQRRIVPLKTKTSGLVLQLLTGISKLRVAAAEGHAFAQWARLFSQQRRLQILSRTTGNWLVVFNATFPSVAILTIMMAATAGGTDVPSVRTGDYLAFSVAFGACLSSSVSLSVGALETLGLVPIYEATKPILAALPETTEAKGDPGILTGRIEAHHLTFSYQPEAPPTLVEVSFRTLPGEFIAIVGPSGSGKSTLLRILLGFEQSNNGSVYFDGQDSAGLDVRAVRSQIGVVLQSGRIMAGDLYTNIVGSGSHTLDDAWEAARMAGLDTDIHAMPMGMHSVVSEGANTLSGGQRQRLLIARAIVNRPRMVFFDEATSALDNRTQAIVGESLARLNATRIVIAHRLSTIEHADQIYVMDRGRIVQSGRYAALMKQEGPFAELARRQTV